MPSSKQEGFKADEIASLHSSIWSLHDKEDWRGVEKASADLFLLLGFPEVNALTAGRLVSQAYELSDKAESEQKQGFSKSEADAYNECVLKFKGVENVLGLKPGLAVRQVKWWKAFRHKDWLGVKKWILLQHFKSLGVLHFKAWKASAALIKAGLAHKKKDLAKQEKALTAYWSALKGVPVNKLPFIG